MTPLKTENLHLEFDNNIIHMRVTGDILKDNMEAGLEWIDTVQDMAAEANDNVALRVDLPKSEFEDLGEINKQFERVGRVLRHSKSAEKCALMTDSLFIRNKAKIESAVLPGMEIRTFDLDETIPAERWLKGEPLIQTHDDSPSVADEVESDNPWDNLKVKNLNL